MNPTHEIIIHVRLSNGGWCDFRIQADEKYMDKDWPNVEQDIFNSMCDGGVGFAIQRTYFNRVHVMCVEITVRSLEEATS